MQPPMSMSAHSATAQMLTAVPLSVLFTGLVLAVLQPDFTQDAIAIVLISVCLTYLFYALIGNIRSNRERPTELFYLCYMLFYYLVPGLLHVSIGRFPFYNMTYPPDQIRDAATIVLPFVVAVAVGYRAHSDGMKPSRIVNYLSVELIGFAFLAIALLLSFQIGLEYFQLTRMEQLRVQDILSDPLVLVALSTARSATFLALLMALILLSRNVSFLRVVLMAAAIGCFVLIINPLSVARSSLAAYGFAIIIVFWRFTYRVRMAVVSFLVIGQFTLFPILSLLQRGDLRDFTSVTIVDFFRTNVDFDGFQSTINVVTYANEQGFRWGFNLLSAIFFFVPRSLWADKSPGTGVDAAGFMGYASTNVSAPLPAELYVDFGYAGVFIGGLIAGYFLAHCDSAIRSLRAQGDLLRIVPYACLVAWLFILLRGTLVAVLGPFMVTFALAVLVNTIVHKRGRSA